MTCATTMESSMSAACITSNPEIQKIGRTPDSKLILLFSSYLHPFSNFHYSEFTIGKHRFTSCEQYFHSQKAEAFGDKEVAQRIRSLRYRPDEAKRLGRLVRGFDKDAWDFVRESVMRQGLLAKFGQNPYLALKLRMSRGHMLAEAAPWDKNWGIGRGLHDPASCDPRRWRGTNLLGTHLMRVREELERYPGAFRLPPPTNDPPIAFLNPRTYPPLERQFAQVEAAAVGIDEVDV